MHIKLGLCPSASHRVNIGGGSPCLLLLLVSLLLHVLVVLAVGVQQLIPPGEGGGVVPDEVHVVEVMETGASVEWDQVKRVQGNVVATEGRDDKKSQKRE